MSTSDEIEFATFDPSQLTPEQWGHFKRRVRRNAQAARAQAMRDLASGMLSIVQAAARSGRCIVSLLAGRAANLFSDSWQAYAIRRERRAAVRALSALDDRMLRDIGLGRSEIESVICDPERLMARDPAFARSHQRIARPGAGAGLQQGSKPMLAALLDKSAA
jgi:uncharacterized protein YjiS (DUF1127 family)